MNKTFSSLRRAIVLTLLATWLPFQLALPAPLYAAAGASTPTAADIDAMMAKLRSTDISYFEKKRLATVIFVHQDVYRKAVIMGELPAKSPNVEAFLEYKSHLQADVAERMNLKHRNLTGENIKQPIIPFAYNNILSDDDVITGAGKGGQQLEKLYVESLDELVRERAGQPMTEIDRHRVDVNGLAWDMTQKGALDNYWHKEKYIQPQSGFANQQKLIEAGDKVKVMGFDENGKLITLQGEEAKKAILSLTVDRPLDIPGMVDKGTGSMSDYARMAEIHQVKFKGTLTPEEIATFIRNQKYTDRVVADFKDIAMKDNPALKGELDGFINTSNEIRKQTTARGVAEILEREYGIKIINADGSVNFDKMKEAMQIHQAKQLTQAMPKMIGAVSANEAYKISQWLKGEGPHSGKRTRLRKQLALTYAPFAPDRMNTILADLDKIDIPAEDKAWLKNVLTNDAQQIRNYAEMMRLPPEELVRHLGIEGDNPRAVELLEARDGNVRTLGTEMKRRPGGGKFHEFLKSKTARALNLDTMLDGSRNEKIMLFSMMLLAVSRAYNASERNDEAIKKAGMVLFEMIPLVASVLRFSEGEFKESFKELAMDIFPPLALAQIAFSFIGWTGNIVKDLFTETVWEGLVNEALKELTDDDFEKTKMKYYRLKDREGYLRYLEEVEAGFGRVAKLASMVAPEVDALMSRHPDVKANDAALYTCYYFEEFDVLGIRKSLTENYSVEQIKNRIQAEGGAENLRSSASTPVQRKAAWLIMDNLKIRAGLYTQVLEKFIDRIEKEYNRRKGEEDDELNAIVAQAMAILKELYENAPQPIKDSVWASGKLEDEYRKWVAYLKDYKTEGKEALELKQEMQAIIDDFKEFIKKLGWAVLFQEEKEALNLTNFFYGGERSTLRTSEVLLTDPFRIGTTAKIHPRRASTAWTVFYYALDEQSGLKYLGKLGINKGDAASGGPESFSVIEEPARSTQFSIKKGVWDPPFEKEGENTLYSVLAFGSWGGDPLRDVGYDALADPAEHPEFFDPEKVAYASGPATVTIRKPKISLKLPTVVYKKSPAKAKIYLDVPEYAKDYKSTGAFKLTPPAAGPLPTLIPPELDSISTNSEEPTEAKIEMPKGAEEGVYLVEVKAKVLGLPEEAQPLPQVKSFEYTGGSDPELSDDIKDLLNQMIGLEARASAILAEMRSLADPFLKKASEAFTALDQLEKTAADLKSALALEPRVRSLFDKMSQVEAASKEAGRAGEAAAQAHSTAQGHVLKACETTRAMQGIKDYKKLKELVATVREENAGFESQKTIFDSELANAQSASVNAESLRSEILAVMEEVKGIDLDTSGLIDGLEKGAGAVGEGEEILAQLESSVETLSSIPEPALGLLGKAEVIVEGVENEVDRKAHEEIFKQMQGLSGRIGEHVSSGKGVVSEVRSRLGAVKERLPKAEEKAEKLLTRVEEFQSLIPDDGSLNQMNQGADDARAAYETASAYGESFGELGNNCALCLGEGENIFANAKDPEALTAGLDCSVYANSKAQWNEAKEEAECVCLEGFNWKQDSSGCEKSQAAQLNDLDCSATPGAVALWNADRGEAYCGCVQGQTWNPTRTACVSAGGEQPQQPQGQGTMDPQTQVAQANCGAYPGTVAQWNAAQGRVQCVCTSGYQWNGSACVGDPQTQVAQANCSPYPGTVPQWNAALGQVQCVCPSGTQWNGSSCGVDPQTAVAQANCSAWPGTVAQWNAGTQQVQCVCGGGTQWNGSSCVLDPQAQVAQADCSAWPGTVAQWNAGTGQVQCVCSGGTQWNPTQGTCASPQQQQPTTPYDPNNPYGVFGQQGGIPPQQGGECPPGTTNIGGTCYTQSTGGPVSGTSDPTQGGGQNPPAWGGQTGGGGGGGGTCPDGSIALLGVCSNTAG